MAADILTGLIGFNLAIGAAILAVSLLRYPVRRAFGARVAYGLWLLAPLAGLASLLPARQALPVEPAPLRPLAEAAVERIDTVLAGALVQAELAFIAAWGLGALAALGLMVWRQRASLTLLGRLQTEAPGLVRAANPAVGPAVVGIFNPRIILPADFETRFDAREQTVILAHERAHLAAHDVRINALMALSRCILWFNPLIHLAAHLVRIDQEIACDEAVVARHPGERRAYAGALLKAQVKPAPLPLGCYWPARSRNRLKERLLMLTRKSPSRARRLTGGAVVALAALGAGYAAWAAQPVTAAAPAVLAQAAAPVVKTIQLAQGAAPADGSPQVIKRVVIKHGDGEPMTFEGAEIPPELQAQIDAIDVADGQVEKRVFILRRDRVEGGAGNASAGPIMIHPYDGTGPTVGRLISNFIGDGAADRVARIPIGPGVVKLHCTGNGDGRPVNCEALEGDPADVAQALSQLATAPITAVKDPGDFYVVIRHEQR